MKRFVALLFAALALATIPLAAHAGTKLKVVDVNWRQTRLANPGLGYADSGSTRALGSATPTAHDTSTAVDLRQFVIPFEAQDGTTTVDSLAWLRIDFFPTTTTPTVAADSVYFAIQVSADGVGGWITPTALANTDPAGDAGAGKTVYTLEQSSSNSFFWVVSQQILLGKTFSPALSSATALTWIQLYGYPYMRFIMQSDRTGRFDATVTGFIPESEH